MAESRRLHSSENSPGGSIGDILAAHVDSHDEEQGLDDDMDYEPTTEDSDDGEYYEIEEDADSEFHDAEDSQSGIEVELVSGGGESATGQDGSDTSTEARRPQTRPTERMQPQRVQMASQIFELLGQTGFQQIIASHGRGDEGEDDDDGWGYGFAGSVLRARRRQNATEKRKLPPVPNPEGRRLMDASVFGLSDDYRDTRRKTSKRLARKLLTRELGASRSNDLRTTSALTQDLIPSTSADKIIHYNARCYSGQFSDDGNFFFSCAQDFKVRMYDTSNPYEWKYYKTVDYTSGQWTITDASLSPDNKFLAYSSISSMVCLAPTDPNNSSEPYSLDFSEMSRTRRVRTGRHSSFGIWSLRFSGDGREIVAGTSDHSVYVYDIERRQSILRIPGHQDHVNAVCFGDASSPHLLYSGSDDTLIKVWDRRSMGDSREAGVFMGHTEGLTYVDSKGDGRYVLSNGKDQTMKLWDLRKMMSTEKAVTLDPAAYTTAFDYRFMSFSEPDWRPHPHDCSLVTYRGHSVLKTLIRCHFSPPNSTNSRYLYSGSEDGSVYIYNLDATLAGKINVNQATYHSRPRDGMNDAGFYASDEHRGAWKTCVRDASWHPNAPMIAATSWNGWDMGTGTCSTHSWNEGAEDDEGTPPMGLRVNAKLKRDKTLYGFNQERV